MVLKHSKIRTVEVFLFFLLTVIFCSCSNVDVSINSIYPELIYDYSSSRSEPEIMLSVFSEIASGESRIQSLRIMNENTEMYWIADEVHLLRDKNSRRVYAGFSSFRMPAGKIFDRGVYKATYVTMDGRSVDVLFSINQQDADSYAASALKAGNKQIMIVDSEGYVLYAGNRTDEIADREKIMKKYPSAVYSREYVVNTDFNSVYLMEMDYFN